MIPNPNMANTPAEMEGLIQAALGRLTVLRAEVLTPVERFINDVLAEL